MFYVTIYLKGLALCGGLIIAIGSQNAFVLKQGLKRQHVFAVALACSLCDVVLISLGAFGVGTLIARSTLAMTFARWGGAAFLAWYGVRSLLAAAKGGALLAEADQSALPARKVIALAVGFSLLNPHAWIDTVVLLGSVSGTLAPNERPAFSAGAISASFIWFFVLAYGSRLLRPLFAKPAAWRVLDLCVAAIMFLLAAQLIFAV